MRNFLPTLPAPGAPRLAGALLGSLLVGAGAAPVAAGTPTAPLATADAHINVNITGTVKDAKGGVVPGASVVLKGTTTGTSTDAQGVFRINVPTGNETLVISSVGFKKIEVPLNGRTSVDVALEDETSALNEVVVVGYGTQSKATLTGSVATVDMKAVQELPVGSLSTALAGQLPGVSVSGGTGRPGDPGQITVRNPTLLSKDGGTLQPLFVIDNVVRSSEDFNLLDQSEVESISILKDAAAAIYGARSNQGVVMVTTKRGKVGPPKLSYSGSVGSADAVRLPDMMDAVQHATWMNDYNLERGRQSSDNEIYSPDELEHFRHNNYNWLKAAWKPAIVTRHAFNVSGGSERATYFAGVSYNYQNGNFDNINANKWTFRANTDVQLAKGLRAGLQLSGDLYQKRMYYLKQGGENPENDMKSLLYTPQFNLPYIDGKPVLLSTGNANSVDAFHFFEVQRSDNFTATRNTGLNIRAELDYEFPFLKGLKARVLYSKTMDNSFGKQYGTKYTVYRYEGMGEHKHIQGGRLLGTSVLDNGDRVRWNPTFLDSYQLNGYLNFDREFGKHHVSAIAFFEQTESKADGIASMAQGTILGAGANLGFATGTQTVGPESEVESGLLSYAARVNYSFANKYLLETSLRYDASTNFAPELRWGFFPSVSAGWVISEEPFFRDNVSFVDMLKVRGSVGFLGGDATKPYMWLESYKIQTGKAPVFGGNNDRGLVFAANNTMANRKARWDDNTKYNAGFDAQFLNNKVSFSVDGYYDKRYNVLTNISSSAPWLIGATLPSENFAAVNGFGTEVSLGYSGQVGTDLSYRINSFFSWNDNKQVKVDVERGKIGTYEDPTGRSQDMGVQGFRYLGMFRNQGEVDAWLAQYPTYKLFGQVPKPGMLYYADIRGPKDASGQYTGPDGIITDVDMEYLTKKQNNHFGAGLNPSITWRGLTVSMTMGISWGGQAMVESAARKAATATSNRPAFWADHWSPENQGAKYPAPYYASSYDQPSAFWFRSSLSASMRNATVSYSLPATLSKRMGVGNVNVYFVTMNPINFYNPYDYKAFSGAYDAYPTLRSLSLGLNVGL